MPNRLILILGFGALIYGGFETAIAVQGTSEPEVVTLTDLGKKDGTNNVHLTITDFEFGENYLIESDDTGRWKRVWFPLVLPGEKWTERPVVAYATHLNQETELNPLLARRSLTGVVTNVSQRLGSDQQEQFKKMYPDANLSGAIAFHIDRRLPSLFLMIPLTLLGLAMVIFSLGDLFGLFHRNQVQIEQTQIGTGSAWAEPPVEPTDRDKA